MNGVSATCNPISRYTPTLTLSNYLQDLTLENPDPDNSYFRLKVRKNGLHLHHLPYETMFNVASNLWVKDLMSLGRAFKWSKKYSDYMQTLYRVFCRLLPPRIFPLGNNGTIIYSGGESGRVFFSGADKASLIPQSKKKYRYVNFGEIESLYNHLIRSVFYNRLNEYDFTLIVHTEDEKVLFLRGDGYHSPFPEQLNIKPVISTADANCAFYACTQKKLFRFYLVRPMETKVWWDPDYRDIEQIATSYSTLALKYKDGSTKVYENHQLRFEFECVDKLLQRSGKIILLMKDRITHIVGDFRGSICQKDFISLRGKKIKEVSEGGRFVLTEDSECWEHEGYDYVQVRTLDNISHAIELDYRSSLFLADGKLYYTGTGGTTRYLVSDNPDGEYLEPILCALTKEFTIKEIWYDGSDVWFTRDDGVVYKLTEIKENENTKFQYVLNYQFKDLSAIGFTGLMLAKWNHVCAKCSTKGNDREILKARNLIASCTHLAELFEKIETIEAITITQELHDFKEYLKSSLSSGL